MQVTLSESQQGHAIGLVARLVAVQNTVFCRSVLPAASAVLAFYTLSAGAFKRCTSLMFCGVSIGDHYRQGWLRIVKRITCVDDGDIN